MKKSITLNSVGAAVVAMIMVLLCYKVTFPAGLVYDRADWGTFGDFFGGLLNPFIGIINIYLLAHISKVVEERDEERHQSSLAIQKETSLYELRHRALTEVVEIINDIYDEGVKEKDAMQSEISLLRNKLFTFFRVHSHLIKSFEGADDIFRETIQQLLNNSNQRFYDRKNNSGNASSLNDELGAFLDQLLNSMEGLILRAQREFKI